MPCVNDEDAIKAAKKAALGLFGSLRRPDAVAIRLGEDWLVGFISRRHKGDETSIEVKWAYVDCKGVALERMPDDVNAVLEGLLEDLPQILKKELETRAGRRP
ncbi:MAG: hypothetical protein QXP98_02500 [Thermoproteus sp.]